jgi:hypothetical protein
MLSILVRQPLDEGLATGSLRRGVPPEDATKQRAQLEEATYDGVDRHQTLGAHESSRISKCAVESAARKFDHPHIMERDVSEKRMRTKIQPLKVRGIYPRPGAHPLPFAAV